MEATQILMQEHRVIEDVLAVLEQGVSRLEHGDQVNLDLFRDASVFFKGFTDGCHHKKEEKILFPSMAEYGIPVENGPLGVMLSEHDAGRVYVRSIQDTVNLVEMGSQSDREKLIDTVKNLTLLLRQHILKEDQILFPMADRVIPLDQQEKVLEGFEHIEHEETGEGIHEKYLALAKKMETYFMEQV